MRNLFIILLLTSGVIVMNSCKKKSSDDSETTTPASPTAEMITGGSSRSWKTVARKQDGKSVDVDSCDKDDLLTFIKQGNTGSFNPGKMRCSSLEIEVTGTWALANNDKTLSISGVVFGIPVTQTYTIISITNAEAVIQYTSDENGTIVTKEDTLNPL